MFIKETVKGLRDILPVSGDEVFVCTPAYAARVQKENFSPS